MMQSLLDKGLVLINTYGVQIIAAIITLVLGYLLAKILGHSAEQLYRRSKDPSKSVAAVIRKSVVIAVMLVVFIAVLDRFGVQTTSIIAMLGAAGLAIGLALQGTLSNVAAGMMLLILRPFRSGDAIQSAGGEIYLVDEIGLFVTLAHKPDCPRVMIPNSKIWGDTIVNYSDTDAGLRRFDILFGVSYSDDITKAISVLDTLAQNDQRVLADPEPLIKVENLGDNSVNILFRVYTKSDDWWFAKLDLTKAGKEALEAAGITIPFPQRDVHMVK
ncbi:MAG: mechanosensitive ion channel [Proteobacteria bacterium]|nr:mechanosensitive ion channel [Pseudomonadota bacterium]